MNNFQPLEVVGRGSGTQLQVGKNLNKKINLMGRGLMGPQGSRGRAHIYMRTYPHSCTLIQSVYMIIFRHLCTLVQSVHIRKYPRSCKTTLVQRVHI